MCEFKSGVIDDKYQVLKFIGEGGFASVYKARAFKNNEIVAIKFYSGFHDEIDIPRFHREVKMMSLINHKNVIKVLDYNIETSNPYIVMPLAKYPLSECIEDLNSSEEITIDIFLQACEGVKELHKNGIYHRDIKASNILISQSDEVLIADLGLARLENRDSPTITQSYDWVGTGSYTPPEFYSHNGYKNGDERGDIYQLGKTLYNLLTGKAPGLLDLKLLSSGLQIIILKATQENPDDRYRSVDELISSIEYYLDYSKPNSDPKDLYEFYLDELNKLSHNDLYDLSIVEKMLELLYTCKDNDELFLELFDKIPIKLLEHLAREMGTTFKLILQQYSSIMDTLVEKYNNGWNYWEYAENIAWRMRLLYNNTSNIQYKLYSLRIILKTSVAAERFAAMDVFNKILLSVNNREEGTAISMMLSEEKEDYFKLVNTVPVPIEKLHYSLRRIRRSVESLEGI